MAILMAILIAVLIDRGAEYVPGIKSLLRFRSTAWVGMYNNKMLTLLARTNVKNNFLLLIGLFLPLWVGIILLRLLCGLLLGTIGKVLFMALVLLYFLENNDLDQQQSPLVQAHERSFAILFWFAILGPFGALLYWFLVVNEKNETVGSAATIVHALAAWIPARITGFIYALVGYFTPTFKSWVACMSNLTLPSSQVLVDCGRAAVDTSDPDDEIELTQRAYVAWVVLSILLAIFV